MRKLILMSLLATLPLGAVATDADTQQRVARSKAAVKEYFGLLKGELQRSMKQGGPVLAISACNKSAPEIAHAISQKHGLKISRTTLKTRNSANTPDPWERSVLEKFNARRAAGESPGKMAYYEVVESGGKKQFRFMKAIPMPPLSKMPCLKCHGESIAPKISAQLSEHYPQDMATGYKVGEIRGAFSVTQDM